MAISCPNLILTLPVLAVDPNVKGKTPVLRVQKLTSVQLALRFLINRSSYRHRTSSHEDNVELETDEEPVFTGEDLSQVDDTLLDLEPKQTYNMAPVTRISPLTEPSSASLPATSFQANTRPVQQSSDSSPALFRAPDPVLTQDTISTGQTPSRRGDRTYFPTFSMPQPQRTATPQVHPSNSQDAVT